MGNRLLSEQGDSRTLMEEESGRDVAGKQEELRVVWVTLASDVRVQQAATGLSPNWKFCGRGSDRTSGLNDRYGGLQRLPALPPIRPPRQGSEPFSSQPNNMLE